MRFGQAGAWVAGFGVLVLVLILAGRLTVPAGLYGDLWSADRERWVDYALGASAAYAAVVALVRARPIPAWAVTTALLAGFAARLVLVALPPVMTTDLYRYVWDGRVQAAGINPYLYKPADPALAFLRDPGQRPDAIFANINRSDTARTIYPPAAQLLFAAIGQAAPSIWSIKGAMLVFDLIAGGCAWAMLRAAGRPDSWLLIWGLNPLAITEFAGAGHIDAASVATSALAMLLAVASRPGLAGAVLGVSVLLKLLPAALGPAVWRPRVWRAPAAGLAIVLGGYALYASAGPYLIGYLPGYAQEEGLDQGGGFLIPRLLAQLMTLPGWAGPAYVALSLLLLVALALLILWRPGPPRADVIAGDALALAVALLVTLSPHYPWYLTMVIVPLVVTPRWGALWLTLCAPLLYWDGIQDRPIWPAVVYLPALLWLLFDVARRSNHA